MNQDVLRRELVNTDALIEKLESLQVHIERDSLSQQSVQAGTLYQAAKTKRDNNEVAPKVAVRLGEQRLAAATLASKQAQYDSLTKRLSREKISTCCRVQLNWQIER